MFDELQFFKISILQKHISASKEIAHWRDDKKYVAYFRAVKFFKYCNT